MRQSHPGLVLAILMMAGCWSQNKSDEPTTRPPNKTQSPTMQTQSPVDPSKIIRIDAGSTKPITDSDGNTWQPDKGFTGGGMVDRGNIKIEQTSNIAMYRTEHWGMNVFSMPLANGKYTVKLHFAETYPEITAAGQRVFTVKVEDQEIKDLDVFKEAGGANKALVKTVNVMVKDAKLDITFTFGEQNPEINGIEIIPNS